MSGERVIVSEDGEVMLPMELRERLDIEPGDTVVVHERDETIVIEPSVDRMQLAEGYRRRAERDARIAAKLEGMSREANEHLDDAPEW